MTDQTVSPNPLFSAARPRVRARRRAIGWSDVLRAVPRDIVRERVLTRYRGAGFTPDAFAHDSRARAYMADCLTSAEDWLELAHPKLKGDREALAAVRRPLELEIR